MIYVKTFISVVVIGISCLFGNEALKSMRSVEELALDYEDDKNSMIAVTEQEESDSYGDFYDEIDNRIRVEQSMNIIFFGPPNSFMRLDAESILHILLYTKKHLIPNSRALMAWDIITDGKTSAFLQGREFLAFGNLLNVVPEEDLYYVNFGDISVLKFFANEKLELHKRKYGVLAAAYKRYYGNFWYRNSSYINDLGYLFCGLTAVEMTRITPKVFMDINTETFEKLEKCNYNQTKTLYNIATSRKAHGLPYKWTSHEIQKLGLLFTCIPKSDISSIPLEAITGISKKVVLKINQAKLEYFTKQQILRMQPKTRRIYILRMQLKSSLDMSQIARQCNERNTKQSDLFIIVNIITIILEYIILSTH